jgi:hypothetical protein
MMMLMLLDTAAAALIETGDEGFSCARGRIERGACLRCKCVEVNDELIDLQIDSPRPRG